MAWRGSSFSSCYNALIMSTSGAKGIGNLVVVLGDQLNADSAAFDGFEPACDVVWMAEVDAEAEHVWSQKARIAIFLAAMRHFAASLRNRDIRVDYRELDAPHNAGSLEAELAAALRRHKPRQVVAVQPGAWRVEQMLRRVARDAGVPLDLRPDRTFLCSDDEFADHAARRKQLRQEYFYREMRKRTGWLMDEGKPAGGAWNYDAENRGSFDKAGPGHMPLPPAFPPDAITREVIDLVNRRFASHPGSLNRFDWPVTPADARRALDDFIAQRLPNFGTYQDAMWTNQPFLYHSLLSSAMNLKLLDPREVIEAAVEACQAGAAPLHSAEGFVRQVLGWREYVRGVYRRFMPDYLDRNALGAQADLPAWYWTGDTDAHCLHCAIRQTLEFGYAHHIQRLMVTGLFALLLGVRPRAVHEWYLAVYVDAVEWVELPNTLGMSQFADGGVMASKPYAATGKYIHRMSNYCDECRFSSDQSTGDKACPFTTLYWDFLNRHKKTLSANPRMKLQVKNLARLDRSTLRDIRRRADGLRRKPAAL